MARIRYIKPEFFTDEDVGRLSLAARLLFVGLWTEADRRGRLPEKPTTLKVKLLPYDELDIETLLGELQKAGRIVRYEVNGGRFIAIPNFEKHQRPHPKEPDLGYPDPPEPWKEISGRVFPRQEIKAPHPIPSSPVEGEGEGKRKGREPAAPVGSLRDSLEAVFKELRGSPYDWRTADDNALRQIIRHDESEIVARWRVALNTKFPRCRGVADLAREWNAYAPPKAAAAPTPGPSTVPFDGSFDLYADERGGA